MKRSVVFLALLLLAAAAAAEPDILVKRADRTAAKARWTPEALAAAKAMPLPRVAGGAEEILRAVVDKVAADPKPFKEIFRSYAEGPILSAEERARFAKKLYSYTEEELALLRGRETPVPEPAEKNYGTAGLDYTSSRLIPSSAVETFPYSAVGKLFFSDGTDDFVCSAAAITKRLVVTAGHCVHDGPSGDFFDDFLFVPAFLNGDAPYGAWDYSTAFVTSIWANSGEVPNANDFAILEMEDQNGSRIADVTGKLSFVANLLSDNHITLLGYPVAFDSGQQMHQVTSGDYIDFVESTVVYGSDMSGGSSGGPWVQNFNRKSQGQGGGFNRARAAVVGVTSYGFDDDTVRVQGASILTRDFKILRQAACFNQTGNC